jgi:hypothetical protein
VCRALGLVSGTTRVLDPDLDMFAIAAAVSARRYFTEARESPR